MPELFDYINAINLKQGYNLLSESDVQDKRKWSSFMYIRFMSMDASAVVLVNEFQPFLGKVGEEEMYKLFYKIIPKRHYDLKSKNKKNKDEDYFKEFVSYLSTILNVSHNESKQYIGQLTKPEIGKILEESNLSDLHVKKLKEYFNVK